MGRAWRAIGREAGRLAARWRRLSGPAPMDEFSDYDDYWERRGPLKRVLRRWVLAAEWIADGSTVLDVGCGTGQFLMHLQSRKPNVHGSGVDFSQRSVEMTRSQGFEAQVADISREAVTGRYDYVTCFEVLEHIAEAEVALRHLKQSFGRRLILSTPNVGYVGCRVRLAVFGRFPTTRCVMHIKEHVRHWTKKDFIDWLATEDLRVVAVEGEFGSKGTPWRRWPSLFARGLVYLVEHAPQEPPGEIRSR